MITNILLLIIIVLFGCYFVSNYFKNRYFNVGVGVGVKKATRAIIEQAKKGESFNLRDDQDEIKLIMITKKNAKSISGGSERSL